VPKYQLTPLASWCAVAALATTKETSALGAQAASFMTPGFASL